MSDQPTKPTRRQLTLELDRNVVVIAVKCLDRYEAIRLHDSLSAELREMGTMTLTVDGATPA